MKRERVSQILEMLQAGQPRERIADQFGYSTWKSLDIYMRRHGFTWDSRRQIYTNAESEATFKKPTRAPIAEDGDLTDVNPEEIIRLFSLGILDAREIAKKKGFSGHKEMAAYMLRRGYVWSSATSNYIDSNPYQEKAGLNTCAVVQNNPQESYQLHTVHSLSEVPVDQKYITLLEFLWQSRDKLIKLLESMNTKDKIRVYTIPGQAKTKSIFLSDRLSDLMLTLCEEHSLSQKQGYEAALVEYLSKYGYRDQVEQLFEVHNSI